MSNDYRLVILDNITNYVLVYYSTINNYNSRDKINIWIKDK
jgi:hypothetical protein